MTYWTEALKSPAGRCVGYVVTNEAEEVIARFFNRDYPSWRIAKQHAERLLALLNRGA